MMMPRLPLPYAFIARGLGLVYFTLLTLPLRAEPLGWQEVVRETPYWESQGVARNLKTLRDWVLRGASYCAEPQRHILFDRRMRFLGYFSNEDEPKATQRLLNDQRQRLAREGQVHRAELGSMTRIGYPFALACDQPHVDLTRAVGRMVGSEPEDLLWGTWDGLRVGSAQKPVPLVEMMQRLYQKRREQGVLSFPDDLLPYLFGQVLIESGGIKESRSVAQARGLMQLLPRVLRDCGIAPRHYLHRMAQVDCALRLFEQNHRLLAPVFEQRFGALVQDKQQVLYGLLLVQAYHGGIGRVRELLLDEELGAAARYFAEHGAQYTAEDIALGLIFHNLGRRELGFASLYYLTDVAIAAELLCEQPELRQQAWCQVPAI